MTRTADIETDKTMVADFHSRLRDHLAHSKETDRPLLLTADGQTQAVVLSPAMFSDLLKQADLTESLGQLDQSMDDIRAGRTLPAEAAIRSLSAEFNLPRP